MTNRTAFILTVSSVLTVVTSILGVYKATAQRQVLAGDPALGCRYEKDTLIESQTKTERLIDCIKPSGSCLAPELSKDKRSDRACPRERAPSVPASSRPCGSREK